MPYVESTVFPRADIYEVFVMVCPANLPLSFATHPWFVINRKGSVSRWGVSFRKRERELSWGHLNKDLLPPFQGLEIIPFTTTPSWKGHVLYHLQGKEGSAAERMSKLIEQSETLYPHIHQYSLLGPNSNTYVQWIFDQFPDTKMSLPWNAFGKGYRVSLRATE